MAGLNQLHIGTVVGKKHGGRKEVKPLLATCEGKSVIADKKNHVLAQEWGRTRSGAQAVRQAIDAVIAGEKLEEYSAKHKELRAALTKWGQKQR